MEIIILASQLVCGVTRKLVYEEEKDLPGM